VVVLYCLVPFYWMFVSAFRRPSDQFDNSALPSPWSTQNFSAVFKHGVGFGRALLNSLVVAGLTTVITLVVGTLTAYALARLNFRFKNAVLGVIIATAMFPGISLIVPLLKLFSDIGWINTYQAMIVPTLSFALPLAVWNLTAARGARRSARSSSRCPPRASSRPRSSRSSPRGTSTSSRSAW
jgi:multiple sugar transport system permease protein